MQIAPICRRVGSVQERARRWRSLRSSPVSLRVLGSVSLALPPRIGMQRRMSWRRSQRPADREAGPGCRCARNLIEGITDGRITPHANVLHDMVGYRCGTCRAGRRRSTEGEQEDRPQRSDPHSHPTHLLNRSASAVLVSVTGNRAGGGSGKLPYSVMAGWPRQHSHDEVLPQAHRNSEASAFNNEALRISAGLVA